MKPQAVIWPRNRYVPTSRRKNPETVHETGVTSSAPSQGDTCVVFNLFRRKNIQKEQERLGEQERIKAQEALAEEQRIKDQKAHREREQARLDEQERVQQQARFKEQEQLREQTQIKQENNSDRKQRSMSWPGRKNRKIKRSANHSISRKPLRIRKSPSPPHFRKKRSFQPP